MCAYVCCWRPYPWTCQSSSLLGRWPSPHPGSVGPGTARAPQHPCRTHAQHTLVTCDPSLGGTNQRAQAPQTQRANSPRNHAYAALGKNGLAQHARLLHIALLHPPSPCPPPKTTVAQSITMLSCPAQHQLSRQNTPAAVLTMPWLTCLLASSRTCTGPEPCAQSPGRTPPAGQKTPCSCMFRPIVGSHVVPTVGPRSCHNGAGHGGSSGPRSSVTLEGVSSASLIMR